MSYRAHVASRYDVRFEGAEWGYDDFDRLWRLMQDVAYEEGGIDFEGWEDEWSDNKEVDKAYLRKVLEFISDKQEEEYKELADFIADLLDTSDSLLEYVRIEAY